MNPTADRNTLRNIAIYAVIGLVLLAVVVLGVRWAKNRADFYAANPSGTPVAVQPPADTSNPQPPADTKKDTDKDKNKTPTVIPGPSKPAPAPAVPSQPVPNTGIPVTGPEDTFVAIVGFAAIAFATGYYVQTRRRLLTVR